MSGMVRRHPTRDLQNKALAPIVLPFFCLTLRSLLFNIIQLQFDRIRRFMDCAYDGV